MKFTEDIIIKYSKTSTLNPDTLDKLAINFRKNFPKNYWNQSVDVIRLDTKPNENGTVWFERVFVEEDAKGNIKVLAACKVIFEGTDPVMARFNPQIKDIILELDKNKLKNYATTIKFLIKENGLKVSPPRKREDESFYKTVKPPEVEKLKD